MRKFLLIASLLMGITSFAQSTTEEEFNYMNGGLKIQMENGLDMKKGYKIVNELVSHVINANYPNERYAFSLLLREREDSIEEIAGILVWRFDKKTKSKEYLGGIPFLLYNKKGDQSNIQTRYARYLSNNTFYRESQNHFDSVVFIMSFSEYVAQVLSHYHWTNYVLNNQQK